MVISPSATYISSTVFLRPCMSTRSFSEKLPFEKGAKKIKCGRHEQSVNISPLLQTPRHDNQPQDKQNARATELLLYTHRRLRPSSYQAPHADRAPQDARGCGTLDGVLLRQTAPTGYQSTTATAAAVFCTPTLVPIAIGVKVGVSLLEGAEHGSHHGCPDETGGRCGRGCGFDVDIRNVSSVVMCGASSS